MSSTCKDKIVRYGVHSAARKIIGTHCTVVIWESKIEKIKEHLISTGKGRKGPLDTVLLKVYHTSKG